MNSQGKQQLNKKALEVLMGMDFTPMAFYYLDWENYSQELAEATYTKLDGQLTAAELSTFWNEHFDDFIEEQKKQKPKTIDRESYLDDYSGLVFSCLLSHCLHDKEEVTWNVPKRCAGKMTFLGSYLTKGVLTIEGDCGDYTADSVRGTAKVIVRGNVANSVAYRAGGNAEVIIEGNAGNFAGDNMGESAKLVIKGSAASMLGYSARDTASIEVWGDAGDLVGESIHDHASIYVKGNVGKDAGYEASGNTQITIDGNAGEDVGIFAAHQVVIEVKGDAKSIGKVQENFEGTITVGGKRIEPTVSHSTSVDTRPGGKQIPSNDPSITYARDVGDD